jgi:hypothetical protein
MNTHHIPPVRWMVQSMCQFFHCIAYIQTDAVTVLSHHQILTNFIGVIQCHIIKPKDHLWYPVGGPALPTNVVQHLSTVVLVNQMKLCAILLCLHRACNF